MSVIDAALRISQRLSVITHDQIMAEMVRRLETRGFGVKVAEHLRIPQSRISEMKHGTRRIQQHEMEPLARFLGMVGDVQTEPTTAEVINIWDRIPSTRRSHALDVLVTFVKEEGR